MAQDDILWTFDDEAIESYFNEFINKEYPNFRFKFDWKNFPKIKIYLIRLMYTSFAHSYDIRNQLPEIIHDVEIFFATCFATGIITRQNLSRILKRLIDKDNGFRIAEFLPSELSGVFGNSIGNRIQINRRMTRHSNSPDLSAAEIRRLYMFHEMGHKILNILANEEVINFFTNTIASTLASKGLEGADLHYKEFIKEGFWMIEECLAQELAEYLTYYSANKERPEFTTRRDLDCVILSNLDFYGIFQMPTIKLGRTIRGCAKPSSTNEEILLNMIRKALNTNFNLELISEYNQGDANLYHDLFLTLRAMGMIKVMKYASFGIGSSINVNTQSCLNAIENITRRNRDYRDYPEGGYPTDPRAPSGHYHR